MHVWGLPAPNRSLCCATADAADAVAHTAASRHVLLSLVALRSCHSPMRTQAEPGQDPNAEPAGLHCLPCYRRLHAVPCTLLMRVSHKTTQITHSLDNHTLTGRSGCSAGAPTTPWLRPLRLCHLLSRRHITGAYAPSTPWLLWLPNLTLVGCLYGWHLLIHPGTPHSALVSFDLRQRSFFPWIPVRLRIHVQRHSHGRLIRIVLLVADWHR